LQYSSYKYLNKNSSSSNFGYLNVRVKNTGCRLDGTIWRSILTGRGVGAIVDGAAGSKFALVLLGSCTETKLKLKKI
jgi:hypothetical protein